MTKHGVCDSRSILGLVVVSLAGLGVSVGACGADHGGQLAPGFAGAGGGSGGDAGSGGVGGDRGGASGANGGGTSSDAGPGGSGGGGLAGAGGDDGQDAEPPIDSGQPSASCIFHTERPVDAGAYVDATSAAEAGASEAGPSADTDAADVAGGDGATEASIGGEGGPRVDAGAGDAGPAPSITILVSPFLGPYLADSAGRALYTYGGDMAGDCKYAPISTCELDCAIAWPIFNGGARTLAPALDDRAFGTIQRTDGTFQTTYFGWPLYYYKSDTASGMITGQAKAKTWHAATVIPVGVVILKDAAAVKYLADGAGKTLYVFGEDTRGTATSDPVSSCSGSCLGEHPLFQRSRLSVVSSLIPTDFTVFVRGVGGQQLAYKGAPLYYGAVDERSGDEKGATTPGWSVAVP